MSRSTRALIPIQRRGIAGTFIWLMSELLRRHSTSWMVILGNLSVHWGKIFGGINSAWTGNIRSPANLSPTEHIVYGCRDELSIDLVIAIWLTIASLLIFLPRCCRYLFGGYNIRLDNGDCRFRRFRLFFSTKIKCVILHADRKELRSYVLSQENSSNQNQTNWLNFLVAPTKNLFSQLEIFVEIQMNRDSD